MSDVCDRYLIRSKYTSEDQYTSLRSVISESIQCQGWRVEQIDFITGGRSVNKQDLSKNLKFFRVPEDSIKSIHSKLHIPRSLPLVFTVVPSTVRDTLQLPVEVSNTRSL
jgi:hypothetical protein